MDLHSNIIEIITESSISESSGENEIETDIPDVSIFKLPESITTKMPEAFKPQLLGFGPHRGPEKTNDPRTRMEQRKLLVVKTVLQHHKINDFKLGVIDKVLQIVPTIREYYQMLLTDDDASLARDFAVDGLFLLNLLQSYHRASGRDRLLAPDILMVENQIPFVVLKQIHKALRPSSSGGDTFSPNSIFQAFCEAHSPFELCSPSLDQGFPADHLLDYMYYSIYRKSQSSHPVPCSLTISVTDAASFVHAAANFVHKVPQKEIVQLYEKVIKNLKDFSESDISIPSATKLHGIDGLTFHHLPDDNGIGDIRFEENCLLLPCITLNADSEVILKNLVAYEALMSNPGVFPLTTYFGLMCWLVRDVEDVKILKKENIIKGDLSDEEIAKMFVEMSSLIGSLKTKAKPKVIDEVNKFYESTPKIRAHLFLKKLAKWLVEVLTAIGCFVGPTWKILVFMISIGIVITLTYEAYCDAFGCDKESVTLLPYDSI